MSEPQPEIWFIRDGVGGYFPCNWKGLVFTLGLMAACAAAFAAIWWAVTAFHLPAWIIPVSVLGGPLAYIWWVQVAIRHCDPNRKLR